LALDLPIAGRYGVWSCSNFWLGGLVPDIKLDFSHVTYSGVLEIVAPIVPGGILAIGTLVLNPKLASMLLSNPYLGYRSRVAAGIFISYIAGLLLYLLVNYTSYFVGYMVGYFFRNQMTLPTPYKDPLWRRMARIVLGPDLAPATDELYFEELHKKNLREAEAIQDPTQRASRLVFVDNFFGPKQTSDGEWFKWYLVFVAYFSLSDVLAAPWQYFLSMVHTAAWAIVLLMVSNHRHHWLAWVLCLTGILFSNGSSWFSGGVYGDPYATVQTAKLLRLVKPQH
jgi:hypothetical protein